MPTYRELKVKEAGGVSSVGDPRVQPHIDGTTSVHGISNTANLVYNDDPSLLPSQTGQSDKYLTTNGTVASWQTLPGLATSVQVLLVAPADPATGSVYFDGSIQNLRVFNGSSWVTLGSGEAVIAGGSASNPGGTLYNAGDSNDPDTGLAPVDGGTSVA